MKRLKGVAVYSEPLIVDHVLVPPNDWTPDQIIAGLRLLGDLFGLHAGNPYVWKLRPTNSLFCELFLRAFPHTPWVFCVRDPLEVIVARVKDPPDWRTAFGDPLNPLLPYAVDRQYEKVSTEVYFARAFAAFCRAVSKADWTRGKIVKYEYLPDAVWSTIAPHFGFEISPFEREAMAERALLHSKFGERTVFSADGHRKRSSASEEMRRAADLYARPALAELLALRREQSQLV